jgi:hypothetical protein
LIQEHEEWCKKDKCANKQCQAILEYRSRKEFRLDGSHVSFQVCDNVCYQMFRLQKAFGEGKEEPKQERQKRALTFIHEYLKEQEDFEIQKL